MRKNNDNGLKKAGTVSLEDVVAYIRACGVVGDKDADRIADAVAAKIAETAGCGGCDADARVGRVYVNKAETVVAGPGVCCGAGARVEAAADHAADRVADRAAGRVADRAADHAGYTTAPSTFGGPASGVGVASRYYLKVLANGEVFCPYTDRRFLPAQYLRLMALYDNNVDAAIAERYDLKRVWKTLRYELIGLDWMRTHWRAAYDERSVFFPLEDVRGMVRDYLEKLREDLLDMSKCRYVKHGGRYTRRLPGLGHMTLWTRETTKESVSANDSHTTTTVDTVTMTPFLANTVKGIDKCLRRLEFSASYSSVAEVIDEMPKISLWKYGHGHATRNWQPMAWRLAFKKAGAYYTLKSLIRDGIVKFSSDDGTVDTVAGGLAALRAAIREEAYVIHAILKRSMAKAGTSAARIVDRVVNKARK